MAVKLFNNIVLCAMLAGMLPAIAMAQATTRAAAGSELRVLIDISGSMKKNDPHNLRAPALRLLVGLLPEDVRAGVWIFGRGAKRLVAPGPANEKWKQQALKAARQIHSRGLFTNIETALQQATSDWTTPASGHGRNIILLTDGMVDVAKDPGLSVASRRRIITELLPRFQKNGISINTIALSEHADNELMKQLATGTDGWSETAADADQLQRIFLHMFEKTTRVDTLPLRDNRFQVDQSIDELTLLAFSGEGKKTVKLELPDKSRISAKAHPKAVKWRHEQGYDLITITKPMAGEWRLLAELDPDNRVMIVTDLKMQVSELPNHILMGESFDYDAGLTEKGKPVAREAFLKLLRARLSITDDSGQTEIVELAPRAGGRFGTQVGDKLGYGRYELLTRIDGGTFQREQRQTVKVHKSPVKTTLEPMGPNSYRIRIEAQPELVVADSVVIDASLSSQSGQVSKAVFTALSEGGWQLELQDLQPGQYTLSMQIKARSPRGREISASPAPLLIGERVDSPPAAEKETAEASPVEETPPPPPVENKPTQEAAEEPVDWMKTSLLVVAANLAILVPGVVGFLIWRRRRSKAGTPEEEL